MISKSLILPLRNIAFLRRSLSEADPSIYKIICNERDRQVNGINLIAS
jgi:glycine/serine hydroxymethyltransferase